MEIYNLKKQGEATRYDVEIGLKGRATTVLVELCEEITHA